MTSSKDTIDSTQTKPEETTQEGEEIEVTKVETTTVQDVPDIKQSVKNTESYNFQAETQQLLNIVTHCVYNEREVFLRELISNASDALERLRGVKISGTKTQGLETPMEIFIKADKTGKTLTIKDTGIGMTKDELNDNLGVIARSGSKHFLKEMAEKGVGLNPADIIGQFGVGFYSVFMVADRVEVITKAAVLHEGEPLAYRWESDGTGRYQVSEIDANVAKNLDIGTSIVLYLREDSQEYCEKTRIEGIIKKYSNFVNFPIKVNGHRVNNIKALWIMDSKEITDEEYTDFYKFISGGHDEPLFRLHFRIDAPLDMKCLLFFPSTHTEKMGLERLKPGVNLYSRKILIERQSTKLLPDYLRFVRGVVDSEDLPMSISRESPQDMNLMRRIGDILTRKIIRFMEEKAKRDRNAFTRFYKEFSHFVKEGCCQDYANLTSLSKLLFFESSKIKAGSLTSLDEYVSRCKPEQKNIYYIVTPSRKMAETSPYLELFRQKDVEVLFMFNAIDEFVMANVKTYNSRKLVSVETSDEEEFLQASPGTFQESSEDGNSGRMKDSQRPRRRSDGSISHAMTSKALDQNEVVELTDFLKLSLDKRVKEVRVSRRLRETPAIIVDHQSAALRTMMKMVNQQSQGDDNNDFQLAGQTLEINTGHRLIKNLYHLHKSNPDLAKQIAFQVFDNALMSAGLLEDGRSMLPRINELLLSLTEKEARTETSFDSEKDSLVQKSSNDFGAKMK